MDTFSSASPTKLRRKLSRTRSIDQASVHESDSAGRRPSMFRRKSSSKLDSPPPPVPVAPSLPLPDLDPETAQSSRKMSIIPLTAEEGLSRRQSFVPLPQPRSPNQIYPFQPSFSSTAFHRPFGYQAMSSDPSLHRDLPKSVSSPKNLSETSPYFAHTDRQSGYNPASSRYSIASLYPSPTHNIPSSPSLPNGLNGNGIAPKPFVRKSHRIPPCFNLIVTGPANSGKTNFIRTLLSQLKLSGGKTAVAEMKEKIRLFGMTSDGESVKRTIQSETISVEVFENGEKIKLTVTDTVGWTSMYPEARIDECLRNSIDSIENKFEETLKLERQVVRQSQRRHDQHFHLALYFILPQNIRCEDSEPMHEFDLKGLSRLAKIVNILPVIARVDELTLIRYDQLKQAVRRNLTRVELNFRPFASSGQTSSGDLSHEEEASHMATSPRPRKSANEQNRLSGTNSHKPSDSIPPVPKLPSNSNPNEFDDSALDSDKEHSKPDEDLLEPEPRVIRIRSISAGAPAIRRKSINRLQQAIAQQQETENSDFEHLLPFSVISPESPTSQEPVREYKFGTVQVLNPDHCDFMALKEAIFAKSSALKELTRLEKYENYRTRKLTENSSSQNLSA